jgi:hypothetical protein
MPVTVTPVAATDPDAVAAASTPAADRDILEDTHWQKAGWIARVCKNEDDDGWAVEMCRVGDAEPVFVGPWTMGRDKKNPKPLNAKDFNVLVKSASEVLERAVAFARAKNHKSIVMPSDKGARVRVHLDIVPDEDDPTATLTAFDDATNEELWCRPVLPSFTLSAKAVTALLARSTED